MELRYPEQQTRRAIAQKDYTQRRALLRAQAEALLSGEHPPTTTLGGDKVGFAEYHQTRFAQTLARVEIRVSNLRQEARVEVYRLLEGGQVHQGFEALQPCLQSLEAAQAEQEALDYARVLLQQLGGVYTPQQQAAAPRIIWLALEVARREPQRLGGWRQSYITFHLRAYELAVALFPALGQAAAEKALERTLNAMTQAGILERKSHIGNARDHATGRKLGWSDGTLIKLRLNPDPRCRPAKLTIEELRGSYCDLEAETRKHWTQRRSAKAMTLRKQVEEYQGAMSETGATQREKGILKAILLTAVKTITFSPRFSVSDDLGVWLARGVQQYLSAPQAVQAAWVAGGARRIASALNDFHSLHQWALMLWRILDSHADGWVGLRLALEAMDGVSDSAPIRNRGAWVRSWLRKYRERNSPSELPN